ncbi:hypothetical protein ACOSP7_026197 [Xanthoceras sorbifolium]
MQQPDLQPSSILIIIFFALISTQTSLCADDLQFTNCSQPSDCGNIRGISYPFWGLNRAYYCGQPAFGIECQDNVPKIKIMSNMFRILGISFDITKTLNVARDDLWNDICPTRFANTTLDCSPFLPLQGQRSLTLYHGCTLPPGTVSGFSRQPDCSINDTSINVFYDPLSVLSNPLGGMCNSSVIVPVLEKAGQDLEQNRTTVQDALDQGFELRWNSSDDQCKKCTNPGGYADIIP